MTNTAKKQTPARLVHQPPEQSETAEEQEARIHRTSRMVAEAGGITARHRLLLLCLNVEGERVVKASLDTVSDWTGYSAEVTERIADDLEALQLLRVWRAVENGRRRPRPVAYEIRLDRLAEIRRRDI